MMTKPRCPLVAVVGDQAVLARVVWPFAWITGHQPAECAHAFLDMHDICPTVTDMKTKWLASRELSARPGRVLATVSRAGRVLVTANGKPKAIMIPTSEATFARDLEMLDRVALAQAVQAIRTDSVVNRTDKLTMAEIDAEVAAVRASRRRQ
jgi:hypothetical protein